MRFGFVTFRSHPLDKNLDDYFLNLLKPLIKKSDKHVLGIDKKNTLEQHFHLIISGPKSMDITNLRQKFNSKDFKIFYKKIKDEQLSTYIHPKFESSALQIKMVGTTEEDHMKTLGYCAKEHIHSSCGYSEDEITDAIKYHYATERLDNSQPIENNWRVLTPKNAHAYLEDFSKKEGIHFSEKTFCIELARNRISLINFSEKSKRQLFAELIIANPKDENQNLNQYYEDVLTDTDQYYSSTKFERDTYASMLSDVMSWMKDQEIDIPNKFKDY